MIWPFSLLSRKATAPAQPRDSGGWGSPSLSGAHVTESRVMGLSAHFACVRLIATTLASLPIHIFERTAEGKKIRNDHPAARLLRVKPNSDMVAFTFFEAMQSQICNRGKAFAELQFDRKGNVCEIWPIPPGDVIPRRKNNNGPIEYFFPNSGIVLPAYKILHVPGLGFDGINSFSPIQLFRLNFGIALAVEEFGARFFGEGTNIGGYLEHPNKLTPEVHERLKTSMNEKYAGLQKSHRVIILEDGMKFEKVGLPLKDAEFIQSRRFTANEMARIHGVPPHLIADLERATFSNIEEQSIEAVVYLFRPWVIRWEQALNAKLFTEQEQEKFYIKFSLDGLLRGNMESRYKAYSTGLNNGFLCVDEVREKEELNPLPNGEGKVYRFPLNLGKPEKGERANGQITSE